MGAGAAEGAVDASNLLKPALARGTLRCIGATTLEEYRKFIEKDAALERRFQPIKVDEPTVEETVSILRGLKEKYEVHHGVRITDAAVVAAAELSYRYIADRFLPDKAIDLIDEAGSKLRIETDSMPAELDEISRRITQLEIERAALKREKESKKRLEQVEKELGELQVKRDELSEHWQKEKNILQQVRETKERIEQARSDYELAVREGNLERAAELRHGVLVELERDLEVHTAALKALQVDKKMLIEEVDEDHIAAIVSVWTGIPVSKMVEGEREKLLQMEERLRSRVVGQEEALEVVVAVVRRSRAGIQEENRPLGSFIFIGSTGVGKTELARALAEFLFDDDDALIRIDMSEYMERHAVSRLVGAPPGYVGYEEGGQLTEAVRRRPYSVILLDEIEKAHPEVFNILLQVLDDGRITDNRGRTVSFKNTIIIMTSNLGSQLIMEKVEAITDENRERVYSELRDNLHGLLRQTLRPEFLNRVDDIVVFRPLTHGDVKRIVEIQFERMNRRLDREGITATLSDEARDYLAEEGYDAVFGARPVKRLIQKRITDPLAVRILEGSLGAGDAVRIELDGSGLSFEKVDVE